MEKFLSLLASGDPIVTLLVVVAVVCIALFALLAVVNSKPAKQYEQNKRHEYMRRTVILPLAQWDGDPDD